METVWSLKCCLPWTILDSPVDRERFCSSLKALMILPWFSLSAEKWDIMLLKKLYNWNRGTTPALQINFICWRNGKQTRDEPIIATLKPITDAVFVFILLFFPTCFVAVVVVVLVLLWIASSANETGRSRRLLYIILWNRILLYGKNSQTIQQVRVLKSILTSRGGLVLGFWTSHQSLWVMCRGTWAWDTVHETLRRQVFQI